MRLIDDQVAEGGKDRLLIVFGLAHDPALCIAEEEVVVADDNLRLTGARLRLKEEALLEVGTAMGRAEIAIATAFAVELPADGGQKFVEESALGCAHPALHPVELAARIGGEQRGIRLHLQEAQDADVVGPAHREGGLALDAQAGEEDRQVLLKELALEVDGGGGHHRPLIGCLLGSQGRDGQVGE